MMELTVERVASTHAKLVILSGATEGREFELTAERINIGRADDNVVRLDDTNVSQHHALLVRIGTDYKLRDLISTNGSFVNDERVSGAVLHNGDRIRFGPIEMRFVATTGPTPAPAVPARRAPKVTPERRPEPRRGLLWFKRRSAAAAEAERREERLYRIIGADGRTYGPVNAEELRQWILQGFANEETWVPAVLRRDWKRLDEFPEFAAALEESPAAGAVVDVPPEDKLWRQSPKAGPDTATWLPPRQRPDRRDEIAELEKTLREAVEPAEAGEPEPSAIRRFLPWIVVIGLVGWAGAAYQFERWPFNATGPLEKFGRSATGQLELDPAYRAAAAAEEGKNYRDFVKHAQELVARHPRNSQAHYILGVAYGTLNLFDDAADAFQQAVKLNPDSVDAWSNLGWAYTQRGRFADAVTALEEAVKLKPDDAQTWSNLGGDYAGLGRSEDAVRAYQKAIELKPDYAEAYYNIGSAYAGQKKYVEAVTAFNRALQLKPSYVDAWFNLGVLSQKQNQDGEAVVFFEQAIKLNPNSPDAWGGLVKSHMKLRQFDKARIAAREMKRLDPDKANALAEDLRRIAP